MDKKMENETETGTGVCIVFRSSRFQMAGLYEMILFLENVVPGYHLTLYCRPIYFHLECPHAFRSRA